MTTTDVVLTYTDTAALTVGEWYWYAIRAVNEEGGGEWSETSEALINPDLPSAPIRLAVYDNVMGIHLSWETPVDDGGFSITGYNIWRWNLGTWTEVTTEGVVNTYTDATDLTPGWYRYAVRAVNTKGNGEWSQSSGVTTSTGAPGPATSLIAFVDSSGVMLSWMHRPCWACLL